MVKVQVNTREVLPTVLASVLVTAVEVVPGQLQLLLRDLVVAQQHDHTRQPNPEGDTVNAISVVVAREITPLVELVGLERSAAIKFLHNFSTPINEQSQGALDTARIHGLPALVQH